MNKRQRKKHLKKQLNGDLRCAVKLIKTTMEKIICEIKNNPVEFRRMVLNSGMDDNTKAELVTLATLSQLKLEREKSANEIRKIV